MAETIAIRKVVKPSIEPVSVSDAKLYSKVRGSTEDSLVTTWIKAGRIKAENYQRRSFITQQWRITLNAFPPVSSEIYLPRGPLQSLVSITYTNSLGVDAAYDITKFIVDTDASTIKLKEDELWPSDITLKSLKILYKAGYGDAATDVPENVLDAIYVYVNYRYDNRLGETDVIPRVFYQFLDEERLFRGIK